jgi:UDP-N-acetyl-D-galactosamine dehydrogenase
MNLQSKTFDIIGFGYLSLPLAVEFGKNRANIGYDINQARIKVLQSGKYIRWNAAPKT